MTGFVIFDERTTEIPSKSPTKDRVIEFENT